MKVNKLLVLLSATCMLAVASSTVLAQVPQASTTEAVPETSAAPVAPAAPALPTFVAVPGNVFAALDKGDPRGIFVQAMDAVLRQMGRAPIYISIPTSAVYKSMEEGKLDVGTVVVPLARDAERAWFSAPVLKEYSVVAVLSNKGFPLASVADLRGKSVGARLGYLYPLLENDPAIKIVRYRSDGEMIRALLFGDVTAVLLAGMSDLRGLRNEGVAAKIDILPKAVGSVPLVAVFSRKSFTKDDVDAFDRLMAEFQNTPEWQAILNQNGFADLIRDWPMVSP